MNQGLKRMLSRISDSPKSTLIDRYLVLVSELPTDIEKSDHVLALAESLVEKSPNNALRIAQMVHNADPGNLRAFDVLIAAFESLGKIAKAGVLRLEKEKVEKLGEPQNVTEIISADSFAGQPPPLTAEDVDPTEDGTSIYNLASELAALAGDDSVGGTPSEILLNDSIAAPEGTTELNLDESPNKVDQADQAVPPAPKGRGASPRSVEGERARPLSLSIKPQLPLNRSETVVTKGPANKPKQPTRPPSNLNKLQSLVEGFLRERSSQRSTSESAGVTTPPSASTKSRLGESPREEAPQTRKSHLDAKPTTTRKPAIPKKNDEMSATEVGQSPPRDQELPPTNTSSDTGRAALDWLAADLEAYAAPQNDGGTPLPLLNLKHPSDSDLARHERPGRRRQKGQLTEVVGRDAALPKAPMLPSQFWDPLRAQVAGAKWDAPLAKHKQRRDSILANLDAPKVPLLPVPASLVQAIHDNFQALVASAPDVALVQTWDVMQALWGDRPDAVCAKLLTDLNLARATKGFWGMYLDALLARGAARKVLIEVATVIAKEHQLAWARIAWQRLPTAWRSLGVRGFAWQEDDGIDALLQRLAKRPQITMRSLLLR